MEEEEPASRFLTRVMDEPTSRFNWRRRASSRVKKVMPKNGERLKKPRRLPPPVSEVDRTRPFFGAFERYSAKYISSLCQINSNAETATRYLKLVALEEAEDEKELRVRLSTWSIKRLEDEGYCITGVSAYWKHANQHGKQVASFALGPGIQLPQNKLE